MNKFINKTLLAGILLLLAGRIPALAQQNIQFTQYIFNALSVNPAYAGYKEEWFAQMALRNQWTGVQDAPKTGQMSIDGVIDPERKRMGLGLQVAADKLGPQSATSAYINYAYRLQLDEENTRRLSFGFGAGLSQYAIDYSKLNPVSSTDRNLTGGSASDFMPDFRFGVYYYSPKWYLGASLMDLLSNSVKGASGTEASAEEIIRHRRHLYLMSGMVFELDPGLKFRPSVLLKEDFKGPTSLDINSMVIFLDKFWIGGSYRTGVKLWKKSFDEGLNTKSANSVAGVAQFFISDAFRIGYSYDYSLTSLKSVENGSHEITLGITLSKKAARVLSPRFF